MQMSYKNSIDIAREGRGKCSSVKFVNRKLQIEKSKWERGKWKTLVWKTSACTRFIAL